MKEPAGNRGRQAVTGMLAGVASGVAFGATTVLARSMARDGLGAPTVLTVRFAIGGALLAAMVVATGRSLLPARGERLACFLLGAVGYAVESSLFFAGLQRGSAAAVTVVFYSYPAIVSGIEVLAGTARLTAGLVAAIVLAAAGTAIVVAAGSSVSLGAGAVVFTLAAALSFGLYLLASHRLLARTDRVVGAAWASGGAAVGIGVRYGLAGSFPSPSGYWPRLVGIGVASAVAFGLMFFALGHIGAGRTAIVLNVEAVATVVLGAIFLGEPLSGWQLVGGAVVVAAAVLATVAAPLPP